MISFTCNSQNLIIKSGKIWTGNPKKPWAEAMVTQGQYIIYVGNNNKALKLAEPNTQIIDAQGKMIVPGFTDSHVHFIMGGQDLASVQLRDITSKALFIQRIADFAKKQKPGQWITMGTWDHTLWGGELPAASWIDAVTPDNPVFISRSDGHSALANGLAMKLAGISKETKEIEGGTILRDAEGNPTGIFRDSAMDLFNAVIPANTTEFDDQSLLLAMDLFAKKGITSVHNMGTWDELATFKRAHAKGTLKTRIYANVPLSTYQKLDAELTRKGSGDEWLKIGGLKGFVDGSLGSHTAAMKGPYSDGTTDRGLYITPLDTLYSWVSKADKAGMQIMVHAIGDEAISKQLDIFEKVSKENGKRDRRFRIEHAQHIDAQDIARFAQLKVIASMQPYHCIDDGRWADKYLGPERGKTSYAFNSLVKVGARLTFGSDWFVAPPSPLEGIYAAVTRQTLDGKNPNGWYPEQKISVEQALKAYTINPAFASFEEKQKGSIEIGKYADFVILSDDITQINPEKIKEVKVLKTFVGGKLVFEEIVK